MRVSRTWLRIGALVAILVALIVSIAPVAAVSSGQGTYTRTSTRTESDAGAQTRTRHAGIAKGALSHALQPVDDSLSKGMHLGTARLADPHPNQIIDTDERYQLSPANPRVAHLDINYGTYLCTATFVGPRVLLTAAHCLWGTEYGGWIQDARVVPGKDAASEPYGFAYASTAWVPPDWINSGGAAQDWDWGLLVLDSDALGDSVGHYTLGVLQNPTLSAASFNPAIVGYPGDKPYGTQWKGQKSSFLLVEDFLLYYDIDTYGGQSGSAILRGADDMVVGIHTNGTPTYNIAQRVDPEMLAFLTSGCQEMGCTISSYTETNVPPPPPGPADAFGRTWARTDKPVQDGQAIRTWMWGPQPFTGTMPEEYAESPNQSRTVQYFDKSRMEITDPNADSNSIWYVTNGLLVVELVSGRMQVGANQFTQLTPAQVNVAGDADDPTGPTYATMAGLRDDAPWAAGAVIASRVDRAGNVTPDPGLGSYGITAAELVDVPGIRHRVAAPFWSFMNSSGTVYENGQFYNAPLFQNPYYATGYPIAEAYWATVKVGGTPRDVLMQCFERRCLTYTPGNPAEWQVEMGNVGRHYYSWRYEQPPQPACDPAYPDFCIPPPPPDLNCGDAPVAGHTNFTVLPPDPHGFDTDGDGIGCEQDPGPGGDIPPDQDILYAWNIADWQPYADEHTTVTPAGDALHIRTDTDNPLFGWWDVGTGDYSVSADVRVVQAGAAEESSACVVSRLAADYNSNYALCIYPDGWIQVIYEYVDDTGYHFEDIVEGGYSEHTGPLHEWNTLKIVALDDRLWFLVNGNVFGSVTHAGTSTGRPAMYVVSFDGAWVEYAFRNFNVYSLK